mgnify:CR=1 FL=1
MEKWNLIVDVALCHACNNCVLAAKDELVGNDFPGYSVAHPTQGPGVIRIRRHLRGSGHHVDVAHYPSMCNHCDDAPCVEQGAGAVSKRADGLVIFDPARTQGRRDLLDACPYGAVIWNEDAQRPQTWFFDAHLIDAGSSQPRCADVCPTRAIEAIKLSDEAMAQKASDEGLQTLASTTKARPRVHYRNFGRVDRCFVAGTVLVRSPDALDCVPSATVELLRDGRVVAHDITDAFGDYRLDGLSCEPSQFVLRVRTPGGTEHSIDVSAQGTSTVVPDIVLSSTT